MLSLPLKHETSSYLPYYYLLLLHIDSIDHLNVVCTIKLLNGWYVYSKPLPVWKYQLFIIVLNSVIDSRFPLGNVFSFQFFDNHLHFIYEVPVSLMTFDLLLLRKKSRQVCVYNVPTGLTARSYSPQDTTIIIIVIIIHAD